MADGMIRDIETVIPGDEVICYFPGPGFEYYGGGVFKGTVELVEHHNAYEMVNGYIEITLELIVTDEAAMSAAGYQAITLIDPDGNNTNENGTAIMSVKVTPNHPLLYTLQNPLEPSVGGDLGTGIIYSQDVEPGMYMFGGKVVSVQYHPEARERSFHLILDTPYPYLIVSRNQQGFVEALAEMLNDENSTLMVGGSCGGMVGGFQKTCFLKDTKIRMANGSVKFIQDIKIDDKVQSYDINTEEYKTGTVSHIFHHKPGEMTDYYLVINNELRITPNHPILVDGVWIDAGELKIGDIYGGNTITSIERVYERVPTYNFEVETYHNYVIVWGLEEKSSIAHNLGSSPVTTSSLPGQINVGFEEAGPVASTKLGPPIGGGDDDDGDDDDGDDDDDGEDDGQSNALPAGTQVVYFYSNPETFNQFNLLVSYKQSETEENLYELYGYIDSETGIAERYIAEQDIWIEWTTGSNSNQ